MMLAGTSSKWVGNGSSPSERASSQIRWISSSICARFWSGMDLSRAEEPLERRVDVLLLLDRHRDELVVRDPAERRHQRAGAVAHLLDLAVAEDVAQVDQLVDQIDADPIVRV